VIATPHIGGSTEEAQEIVGVRIAEQMVEYLKSGVAVNAVNMPSLSPEDYKAQEPYIALAERLGAFAAHIASGNLNTVRLTYFGRLAAGNTTLLRNAGLAGVLSRSSSQNPNIINSMQIASERGWNIAENLETRADQPEAIRLELETDGGITLVEGAVVLGKPRLTVVDGIHCEAALSGSLIFMKNQDVPGVIGHVGTVLGRNQINVANFSLGRREAHAEAIAVVSTDGLVPEGVLAQLRENPAVKEARAVALQP
jgi:D-3-phosphoglycerate dehydrogenase